ncbi:MAG: hypothetical protein ACFCVE_00060 [Phycisphaerae bacterium]
MAPDTSDQPAATYDRPRFLPGRPWPLVLVALGGLIVGVLLQLSPFVLAYLAATTDAVRQSTEALRPHAFAFATNAILIALLPLLGFWLFAGSILSLGLRPWGRRLLVAWALAWALYAVIYGLARVLLIKPRLAEGGLATGSVTAELAVVAFSLLLAACVHLGMTRPSVQAAMARR